ncbi:MAG: hypothetical protein KAT68_10255 [Bacteroidales bacterium]|nr:hypothetical protein [Bacteroidales bacterium]
MKKHNGMRPQDVVVLLKIISLANQNWRYSDLAYLLNISQSEVSEALDRCKLAKLVDNKKKDVFRNSLLEFLIYGLKYVFPVQPGANVRGIPTAHSAKPISNLIISDKDIYVWASADGTIRGQSIEPLYKTVPKSVQKDEKLYELLALIDVLRVGKSREIELAKKELTKRIIL